MALYHAGMSEYILGQMDFARTHLKQFIDLYQSRRRLAQQRASTCSAGSTPKP